MFVVEAGISFSGDSHGESQQPDICMLKIEEHKTYEQLNTISGISYLVVRGP